MGAVLEHLPGIGVLFLPLAVRRRIGGILSDLPLFPLLHSKAVQNKVEGILVSILGEKGNREIELVGDEVGGDMSKLKVFVGETVMSTLSRR